MIGFYIDPAFRAAAAFFVNFLSYQMAKLSCHLVSQKCCLFGHWPMDGRYIFMLCINVCMRIHSICLVLFLVDLCML